MSARPSLAAALSDAGDSLVSADPPLAELQRHCGGDIPGTIAIPALLDMVRTVRAKGLHLTRNIVAQDGDQLIRAWVEVSPRGDGVDGCTIVLRNWLAQAVPPEDAMLSEQRRAGIDRDLAELTARLDARQCVLSVEAEAADLDPLAAAMRDGAGRPWTDFVTLDGNGHEQPMHWRLLDGASLRVDGSQRAWRACLLPQQRPGAEPHGFELCLVSDQVLPQAGTRRNEACVPAPAAPIALVGRDIAPVLRQPIASIIANAETIRSRLAGPLDEKYAAYAGDIVSAGQHLLGLLADLSDMEVVESEGFSTAPDRIDLGDVARQAAGILGVKAREKGIAIEAPPLGTGLPATGEFRRVLQVLLNLIGNAIRYSPEGSRVRLELEDRGETVCVIVTDEGSGLTEPDRGKVFEKFERLGRSGDGGSGLGLYISRRLARAMGGELTVESRSGEGARFILELPATPPGTGQA
jgi:hypothetical protein